MITGGQIRAARALLKWKAKDLAEKSGVSWATIQRMETEDGVPNTLAKNVTAVQQALESEGIIFVPEDEAAGAGVRLRKQ